VNADDPQAEFFRRRAGARRVIDFGMDARAQVTASHAIKPLSSELRLRTPQGEAQATLSIPGLHNVRNALAAAAAAHAAGVDARTIAQGLTSFRPYTGRLQVKQARSGATLIDDTYNANPDSVRAAIDVLASCPGPRVLVLSNSGGPGVLCADRCALEGLSLPPLPPALSERLRSALPAEAAVANPLDLLADAREDRFADTFTSAVELAKDAFDAILMIHVVPFMVDGGAVVSRLVELCLQAPLPILHSMMGTLEHKAQWMAQMEAAGVPMFDNAEDMAHAAGMLAR